MESRPGGVPINSRFHEFRTAQRKGRELPRKSSAQPNVPVPASFSGTLSVPAGACRLLPLPAKSHISELIIGTLQLQEKTTTTSAASGAGGYRNHQPPHRPGLHLELATQGIERTKRSAGSPNRLIGRAKLHSAGTGGKLKYSYQVITVLLP